jgi:hypothetical protein
MKKISLKKVTEKLKMKTLFRSTSRISFYGYLLLHLIQDSILNQTYENGYERGITIIYDVVDILIENMKKFKESIEWQLLITLIINDLTDVCLSEGIEVPVAIQLSKALVVGLI